MDRRFALLLGGLALALLAAGVYFQTRRLITVRADGQTRQLTTHAASVADALREAGVVLDPADRLWLGEAPIQTPITDTRLTLPPAAVLSVERVGQVRVEVDGQLQDRRTQATEPAAILAEAGVLLYAGDEVWADGRRVEPGLKLAATPRQLAVRRAFSISISDGGAPYTFQTAARTVGEALWQAGVRVYQADQVDPPAGAPLAPDMSITLTRAPLLTIQADGRTVTVRALAATVGEALALAGQPLAGADYSVPAAADPVPADGVLRVVRVREALLVEQIAIPRETVYQALPEVAIDTVQTLQAGADGARRRTVRVRYEDGVEVSRAAEAESVAQAPEPRVIGYGAQITPRVVETPDGPLEYWRAYTVYATSYSPARAGTPRTARNYGITASGRPLVKGLVAVDRRYIPFGTRMYIPGYGFALAADTGGGVKGRFIDLGYDDANYQHWSQIVTVYFLTPIPAADQIVWIIPATVP